VTDHEAGGHARADAADIAVLRDMAAAAGLRRIAILAWRDLDDPEAGGSELHVAHVASLWSQAGIEVTMRTSYAPGSAQVGWRDGYRVIRKAGRYMVFPRASFSEWMRWHGKSDALVEIWNGMPFFSPVWAANRPRSVWLHHVHDTMWEMMLPPRLARLGRALEFRVAPPIYRHSQIVTLSESSKEEIHAKLGLPVAGITVVPPGIDPSFRAGGSRAPYPLVVAVGRLVRVKRFDVLIDALAKIKARRPDLQAVIVGEGLERDALERQIDELGTTDWISLPGRVDDATLLDLYRSAWVLASASRHEGWGMTITEAAACGTPAVATRIAGHSDAIVDGKTGLLVDDDDELAAALDRLLGDDAFRGVLGKNALEYAMKFTWAATARGTLAVLVAESLRHKKA
jgi:glycosyltransferase involved in cell wall biosynthesis